MFKLIPYRKGDKWGFCDHNKKIIIPIKYDKVVRLSNVVYTYLIDEVSSAKKIGLINLNGNEILPPIYDEISVPSDNLFLVRSDNLWGYANMNGSLIIPLKYEDAGIFSDGLAPVKRKGKWGYINQYNETVIPFQYDHVRYFENGLAVVGSGSDDGVPQKLYTLGNKISQKREYNFHGKYGIINSSGRQVLPIQFDSIRCSIYEFEEEMIKGSGLLIVSQNEKYGCFDRNGNKIIPIIYDDLRTSDNITLEAELYKKHGLININKKVIIPFHYERVSKLNNNLFYVELNGLCGIIDNKENEIVPIKYFYLFNLHNGNHLGYTNEKGSEWEIIENSGKLIKHFSTDSCPSLIHYNSTTIHIIKDGNHGLVNSDGKEIIPAIYEDCNLPSEGLVGVKINNKYGFIDENENIVIPFKYDSVSFFVDGLCRVTLYHNEKCEQNENDSKVGYIDQFGNEYFED